MQQLSLRPASDIYTQFNHVPAAPDPDDYSTASTMLHIALRVLADAAAGNSRDLLWAIQRSGGLTLQEISRQSGVTRQCVHKRLNAMRARNVAMDLFLPFRRCHHD